MPARNIGRVFKKLDGARRRAGSALPGDIDRRLAEITSTVASMAQMPRKQGQEVARRERDELREVRALLLDMVDHGTYALLSNVSLKDIKDALDGAIDGLSDAIGDIDLSL